jgi:hypothetical protein
MFTPRRECPQNVLVPGLSSKIFNILFTIPVVKSDVEESLFFQAILGDLMEVFGGNFKISIYSRYEPKNNYNGSRKNSMTLEMPQSCWISDVACKISELQERLGDDRMTQVEVNTSFSGPTSTTYSYYNILAMNGEYIERKKTTVDYNLVEIDFLGKNVQTPRYHIQTSDF